MRAEVGREGPSAPGGPLSVRCKTSLGVATLASLRARAHRARACTRSAQLELPASEGLPPYGRKFGEYRVDLTGLIPHHGGGGRALWSPLLGLRRVVLRCSRVQIAHVHVAARTEPPYLDGAVGGAETDVVPGQVKTHSGQEHHFPVKVQKQALSPPDRGVQERRPQTLSLYEVVIVRVVSLEHFPPTRPHTEATEGARV